MRYLLLLIILSSCLSCALIPNDINLPPVPNIHICAFDVDKKESYCASIHKPNEVITGSIYDLSIGMTARDYELLNNYIKDLQREIKNKK